LSNRSRGFLTVILFLALAAWLLTGLFRPLDGKAEWRVVTVPQGFPMLAMSEYLQENGLVSYSGKSAFTAAAFITGKGRRLQPGRYRLSTSMSPWEMLCYLAEGKVYSLQLTIPEGFTLKQIGALLEKEGISGREEFIALAARQADNFSTPFPRKGPSLEGYLFPDTYKIDGRQGAEEVIRKMLDRFDEIVWQGLFQGIHEIGVTSNPNHMDLSLHEIITLASLVEGEAKLPEERPLIAGVLINRLRRGMKLECDATVQYALPERKPRLTHADLQIDSPYNTYLFPGLPPGPINNPGRASVEAVLHPKVNSFLYYVAKPDGSHIFSSTFEQHRAAISRLNNAGLRGN
jgi:UPF0755 protein